MLTCAFKIERIKQKYKWESEKPWINIESLNFKQEKEKWKKKMQKRRIETCT